MKQYLITSPAFEGEAKAVYNKGMLISFDVSDTTMGPQLVNYFKKVIPVHEEDMPTTFKADTVVVGSEVVITFEQFWQKYDHKFNRSRCEQLWERLTKTDRTLAYFTIPKYHKYLRKHPTQAKLHPDTYLRDKRWLNDYK